MGKPLDNYSRRIRIVQRLLSLSGHSGDFGVSEASLLVAGDKNKLDHAVQNEADPVFLASPAADFLEGDKEALDALVAGVTQVSTRLLIVLDPHNTEGYVISKQVYLSNGHFGDGAGREFTSEEDPLKLIVEFPRVPFTLAFAASAVAGVQVGSGFPGASVVPEYVPVQVTTEEGRVILVATISAAALTRLLGQQNRICVLVELVSEPFEPLPEG